MNKILYDELIRLAKSKGWTDYSEISPMIGLSMDNPEHRNKISQLLGEIAIHEHSQARPMLTSIVKLKGDNNKSSKGFFSMANELKIYNGSKDEIKQLSFWSDQVKQVHDYWAM